MDDLKYMRGYVPFTGKHFDILYKGLDHLQILVSVGGPGINPLWILGDNDSLIIQNMVSFLHFNKFLWEI